MLSVLLTVLKIAGIVLASLIGIIILLLLLVLFVPLRYEVYARYYDDKPYSKGSVSWLLKLIRFKYEYRHNEQFQYIFKVLFFKLWPKKTDAKPHTGTCSIFDEEDEADSKSADDKSGNDSIESVGDDQSSTDQSSTDQSSGDDCDAEAESDDESDGDGKNFGRVNFGSLYDRVKALKKKLLSLYDSICRKRDDAADKLNAIRDFVNDEDNKRLAGFIISQLKMFLRKLCPKKGRLHVRYGTGDIESTGKVAMYVAVLYGLAGLDVSVIPDFDEKVFEGEMLIKGNIRLVTIVIIAVRLYMNKQFKRVVLKM